ncbi:hypothetical protein [uncultured Enterobacter sp.]|uniref:hypothetical protein n=1 Tax=uncultured Enterobacter sp. TaxID=238202 RepID=UPI00260AA402|nr:hypothetical protein [uncultured Enterobacter sp.]
MLTVLPSQNYWFPGHANHREIFDFTGNILNIETPGFPLAPHDSNNFGNVITLENESGYYIIGKYLMDNNFSVVTGSDGIFDNVPSDIPCCTFAPDMSNPAAAHLYYIDEEGLHYGHISKNIAKESTISAPVLVSLPLPPDKDSPLCILGDGSGTGNWLFYSSGEKDTHVIAAAYCEADSVLCVESTVLNNENNIINIDICQNRISLLTQNADLMYGTLSAADNKMSVDIDYTINNLSSDCIQTAFSSSASSLFWLTKNMEGCAINQLNYLTGEVVTTTVKGDYIALKCGPDNIIYGLDRRELGSSTLLTIMPDDDLGTYSIAEISLATSGGYFPATGWFAYNA